MKKYISLIIMICCLYAPALAQIYIDQIIISKNMDGYTPVDVGFTFPSYVERLYCFTKISGATSETTITHVWYRNNQEMARVDLAVKLSSWRTFSSIKILPYWEGHWWVDVIHGETILAVIDFTIK